MRVNLFPYSTAEHMPEDQFQVDNHENQQENYDEDEKEEVYKHEDLVSPCG